MPPKSWTGSSLASDRIPPRTGPSQHSGPAKGKDRVQTKSPNVLRLESLVKELRKSSDTPAKDPKGGCFCLARDHPLPDHVKSCLSCGLILCEINLPYFACPFCSSPLLSPEDRKLLIADLEKQIVDTLTREAEEKERAVIEAKRRVEAFPSLLDTVPQQRFPTQDPRMNATHKVVSLRTTGKAGSNKVFVSSPSPSGSRPASRGPSDASRALEKEKEKDEVRRVPCPPNQPKYSTRKVDLSSRPWENLLLEGSVVYVPPSRVDG